jgi:hypothetical protein
MFEMLKVVLLKIMQIDVKINPNKVLKPSESTDNIDKGPIAQLVRVADS